MQINHPKTWGGYTLIDLPEAIGLAERFLSNFDTCKGNVKFVDGLHLYTNIYSDLVISNYAFSELQREVQDMYLEKVILNSKRGFITWNNLGQNAFNAHSISELLKIIPGSKIIDEKHLTAKDNCIIIWGYK